MKVIVIGSMLVWGFLVAYIAGGYTAKTEKFVQEQLDARMMGIEEGKLATLKGSSEPVRFYGEWMAADHKRMKEKLQSIAIKKNISIPTRLSEKKAEALEDLRQLQGREFDKEFIKMMRIDHQRDIRCLKTATNSNDPDICTFAQEYLPVLESHLSGLEELPDEDICKQKNK